MFISSRNISNWSSHEVRYIILNSARQHNHFITLCNYKAKCFDYRLVILRAILSIVSQDAMHGILLRSFTQYFSGDQIKNNEMGGECSMYGGEKNWERGFGGETWRKETTWVTQA